MTDRLVKARQSTGPFLLVRTLELVVPRDYNHDTQLTEFLKKHRAEFFYYNDAARDAKFSRATARLIPGHRFWVKIFDIRKPGVSAAELLVFLKQERAVLVGA